MQKGTPCSTLLYYCVVFGWHTVRNVEKYGAWYGIWYCHAAWYDLMVRSISTVPPYDPMVRPNVRQVDKGTCSRYTAGVLLYLQIFNLVGHYFQWCGILLLDCWTKILYIYIYIYIYIYLYEAWQVNNTSTMRTRLVSKLCMRKRFNTRIQQLVCLQFLRENIRSMRWDRCHPYQFIIGMSVHQIYNNCIHSRLNDATTWPRDVRPTAAHLCHVVQDMS